MRAVMALVLATAMTPRPAVAGPVRRAAGRLTPTAATAWERATFSDVPFDFWAWRWIESIAAVGLTSGCVSTPFPRYCPSVPVDQSEITVLLLKAREGRDSQPPPATGAIFSDVPLGYRAAPWIEELARRGVTSGCGGQQYCPASPVTRDEMAVLLVRTFDLPLVDPPDSPTLGPCLLLPASSNGGTTTCSTHSRRLKGATSGLSTQRCCSSIPTRGKPHRRRDQEARASALSRL